MASQLIGSDETDIDFVHKKYMYHGQPPLIHVVILMSRTSQNSTCSTFDPGSQTSVSQLNGLMATLETLEIVVLPPVTEGP